MGNYGFRKSGSFTRRRVGGMISLAMIVEPGSNLDQIGHVGRYTALEQGRIASYDVLITHFALVRLQHNYQRGRTRYYTWEFLYKNQINLKFKSMEQ